ncbi:LOW QUALITY PROTEIN: hypothetical protein Nmel_011232, partial [Mimus melanotis]
MREKGLESPPPRAPPPKSSAPGLPPELGRNALGPGRRRSADAQLVGAYDPPLSFPRGNPGQSPNSAASAARRDEGPVPAGREAGRMDLFGTEREPDPDPRQTLQGRISALLYDQHVPTRSLIVALTAPSTDTTELCRVAGGQKTGEALVSPSPFPSSALTSHPPRETSDFSPVTTAILQTSLEKNLTAATLSTTGAHATEEDDAFIPTTPMAVSEAEGLQASSTASSGDITATHPEHDNMSLSVNSSTEIPSPTLTTSTLQENQPSHEATEPFSTTEEADDASATPIPPLNTVPATTNSSQSGLFDGQTPASTSETKPGTSPVGATEESTVEPRTSSAPISIARSTSFATASSTVSGTPLVTSSMPASTAAIPTSTPTLAHLAGKTRADPLVITVISVFIVMVGILGLVGFLRYRQHNNRMEFQRLQDLPMSSDLQGAYVGYVDLGIPKFPEGVSPPPDVSQLL